MKKLLIVFIMLIGAVAYGQNTFKYEIRATGGLTIGKDGLEVKIDSIALVGVNEVAIYIAGDTAGVRVPYSQRVSLTAAMRSYNTPVNTGDVVAATGITAAMFARVIYYNGSSAIDITANPQIADGSAGQIMTIIGNSDTNTLKLDDGTGLMLEGGVSFTIGAGDVITLMYLVAEDIWIELSRSNN